MFATTPPPFTPPGVMDKKDLNTLEVASSTASNSSSNASSPAPACPLNERELLISSLKNFDPNGLSDLPVSLNDIEEARARISRYIKFTPLMRSEAVERAIAQPTQEQSSTTSRKKKAVRSLELYFKMENNQRTGSCKERGVVNRLLCLSDDEKNRGIIAVSRKGGNFAQAVAYHCSKMKIKCTVFLSDLCPPSRVEKVQETGVDVVQEGFTLEETLSCARSFQQQTNGIFLHPFDDPEMIAGFGTIGLEMYETNPYLNAVIVPVGSGGLISGIAIAIKEANPKIKVIGVVSSGCSAMLAALKAGKPVPITSNKKVSMIPIADSIFSTIVSPTTLKICQRYVDEIVAVDDEQISKAILILIEREKIVVEGAGAAPLAAVMSVALSSLSSLTSSHPSTSHTQPQTDVVMNVGKVGLVLSGGNIDSMMISTVIERGLVESGRLCLLQVGLPNSAEALAEITRIIAHLGANIKRITHIRVPVGQGKFSGLNDSQIELMLETKGFEHIESIVTALKAKFSVKQLT